MMTEKPEKYQHMLQNLVVRAQQVNLVPCFACNHFFKYYSLERQYLSFLGIYIIILPNFLL